MHPVVVTSDDCPVDGGDVLGSLRSTFIMPAASTAEITADNYQQARFLMKTAEFMAEGHRAGGLRELRDRTVAGAGDGEAGSDVSCGENGYDDGDGNGEGGEDDGAEIPPP